MDTERRMTTQEMLTQHKKLMDEAQRLEPSVMVTERNWSAMLEMQDRLFRQQMQLDANLKMLLKMCIRDSVKLLAVDVWIVHQNVVVDILQNQLPIAFKCPLRFRSLLRGSLRETGRERNRIGN